VGRSGKSILGISGIERTFAVSLLTGDAVALAVEEDKLRRFRGLGMRQLKDLGSKAIELALSKVEGGIRALESVAYVPPLGADSAETAEQCAFVSEFLQRYYGFSPPVIVVDHIAAHLAFERAVHGAMQNVLYAGRSHAVYSRGGSASYDFVRDFTAVSFVRRCAEFLGLTQSSIHHIENLAQRGQARFVDQLDALLDRGLDSENTNKALEAITGGPHLYRKDSFNQAHYDLAASLDGLLRAKICDLVRSISEADRASTVALSGGVFQSWSLNDAVSREFSATRFVVSFAPGDPCCAIGGPLVLSGYKGACLRPFLGPRYSRNDVKAVLDNCKSRYELCSFSETLDIASDALKGGKMVGWFSGPCEFGYRALGGRSVFANPADPYASDNLSSFLKRRPAYLTYAVSMNDTDMLTVDSPHLSRSTRLPEYFGDAPVRIQTVKGTDNPELHQLLETFQKRTGVRALLNTSLNYFDEPIACAPRDALKTFYASGLDLLIMESFVLKKS
jgi:predicted NodU family carbamoyl transferase